MKFILNTLIVLLMTATGINAQCEFKTNEVNESKGGKLVITYSDLLHNKGKAADWKVVYGGVSNFYDGTPQIELMVCLADEHFFIKKDDDIVFHFKNGESVSKKNYLRSGAKKKKIGSGKTYCATYSVPLDDELKTIFLKDKKESAIQSLTFSHNRGTEEFKLKKKYANVTSEQVKCTVAAMEK